MIIIDAVWSLKLAERAFTRGTPLNTIIIDGWSRGLTFQQTRDECLQMGFALCVAEPQIHRIWQREDEALAEYERKMREIEERNPLLKGAF